MKMNVPVLAIVLVVIALGGLVACQRYVTLQNARRWQQQPTQQSLIIMQWTQHAQTASTITLDQAKQIAEDYLESTQNPDLAIKEIMEFQYNFYIIYYEKDSGVGAFEMLIWKQAPPSGMMSGGMMGGQVTTGVVVPELGPNMMWNTKYSPMANGMMGYGSQSSTMTVTKDRASQIAQAYLDQNFANAKVEMATQFYGYYTFDFTVDGKIAGMLSVNGSNGKVWYHSWHGDFIQEVEFD